MLAITRRRFAVFLLIAVVGMVAGCGEKKEKTNMVRGKVTFDGKAVPNGTITFVSESGPSPSGEIQPDGSYTLTTYKPGDGAPAGNYRVLIVAIQDQSDRLPEARNPTPPAIVPNKYTSIATTDLVAEVKSGENTIDFPLDPEKK